MISFKQYIEIAERNYFSCLMSQNCNTIQIYANDETTLLQDTTDYFYVEYLFSQNETFRLNRNVPNNYRPGTEQRQRAIYPTT
jgi:hypothetical protein